MAPKIVFPEVPLAHWPIFEFNHTDLVSRGDFASHKLNSKRRVLVFCSAFKVLSSFRKAYYHIISTALKNTSVTTTVISSDISSLSYNTLLMNKLLPQLSLSSDFLHRHFISKPYLFLLVW